MIEVIEVGDPVPLTCTILREDGVTPVDPGGMQFVVTLPDGSTLTAPGDLDLQHPGPGRFLVDVPTTMVGQHAYRWIATGTHAGVQGDVFHVDPAGPRLVSLEEAKRHLAGLKKPCRTPADLENLRALVLVASRAIERDLNRVLTPRTIVETHQGCGTVVLRQGPARQVVSVDVDGQAADAGTWRMQTEGIVETRYGWTTSSLWGAGVVTVTYLAGDPVIDPVARKVCLSLVKRMWQQDRQAPRVPPDDYSTDDLAGAFNTLTPIEQIAYDLLRRGVIA